jgi:hypothetical protein
MRGEGDLGKDCLRLSPSFVSNRIGQGREKGKGWVRRESGGRLGFGPWSSCKEERRERWCPRPIRPNFI